MNARERILTIRLLEKLSRHPELAGAVRAEISPTLNFSRSK